MSGRRAPIESVASRLRREFDDSFAQAPGATRAAAHRFLAIRVGGDPYALALSEVAEVHGARRVTRLPLDVPELLGVASLRGIVAPVYDLAVFLGYRRADAPAATVLARATAPIALAFDAVEPHLTLDSDALVRAPAGDAAGPRPHVAGLLKTTAGVRPIVDLPSVLEKIALRAGPAGARDKE